MTAHLAAPGGSSALSSVGNPTAVRSRPHRESRSLAGVAATSVVLGLALAGVGEATQQAPDQVELEATARKLFADDQLEAAGRLYEELAARSRTEEERGRALTLAAWIAWLHGDEPRAESLLRRLALEAPRYEPDPSQFDADFLARRQRLGDAEALGRANRAAALVDEAASLSRSGDDAAAALRLEQALALEPEHPAALLHSARLASRRGDLPAALVLLQHLESVVTDPARPPGRPSHADVLAERGLALYRAGDFDGAAGALERAAFLAPEQVTTWINLALARERVGDLAGAEDALHRVLDLGHEDAPTRRSLARLLAHRGEWAEARTVLEEAVAAGVSPAELPALLFEIARADRALGRLDAARERLDRVASLLVGAGAAAPVEPGLPVVRRELAFLLLELGDARAALAEAEMAAREAPNDADAQLALGRALFDLGRVADALPALRSARTLAPARADIANALGRALHLEGDPSSAAAAFEDALRLDPTLEAARDNLAVVRADADRAVSGRPVAGAATIFPGLAVRDATWATGGRRAAEIVEVAPDGAAARAGLRRGDLILRIDGAAVTSAAALDTVLRQTSPGRRLRLDLVRGDAPFSVELAR